MLTGKELEMYNAQEKNIIVTFKSGKVLSGYCSEFSAAYDNDDEGASITLKNGRWKETNELSYPLTEIFELEIEKIEYMN